MSEVELLPRPPDGLCVNCGARVDWYGSGGTVRPLLGGDMVIGVHCQYCGTAYERQAVKDVELAEAWLRDTVGSAIFEYMDREILGKP